MLIGHKGVQRDRERERERQKRRRPKVATEQKTPKKKKKKKKKRQAPSNKQINPLSVKSTSRSSMQRLLRGNADITRKAALLEPYLVGFNDFNGTYFFQYNNRPSSVLVYLQFTVGVLIL